MKKADRAEHFMPSGVPKYLRIYDNRGRSGDRYTVVFTRMSDGLCHFLGMSASPFHPQGFAQHGEHDIVIDRPRYSHLGKKIKFADLPEDCQTLVIRDYKEIWRIE